MKDPSRIQIVKHPVRIGPGAVKLTVHPGDVAAKRNRAEIVILPQCPLERENWYGWSMLIPKDYEDYPGQRGFQIMGQFHARPDSLEGEKWGNFPPYPPMISVQYGRDRTGQGFGLFYGLEKARRRIAVCFIEKGKWYDIKLAVRWSKTDQGYVSAWINGEPWTPFNGRDWKCHGANMYNNVPPLLKLGLYRDFGFTTVNSVYYDEVRIGSREQDVLLPNQPGHKAIRIR
ncbi:MAG: polysaccharide lyase [Thermodesulfobacteriota bacterium]